MKEMNVGEKRVFKICWVRIQLTIDSIKNKNGLIKTIKAHSRGHAPVVVGMYPVEDKSKPITSIPNSINRHFKCNENLDAVAW